MKQAPAERWGLCYIKAMEITPISETLSTAITQEPQKRLFLWLVIVSVVAVGFAAATTYLYIETRNKSEKATILQQEFEKDYLSEVTSVSRDVLISDDTIIIAPWGIKLTIPDGLDRNLTYSFSTNYAGDKEATLTISAVVDGYSHISDLVKGLLVSKDCGGGIMYRLSQQEIERAKETNHIYFWYDHYQQGKVLEKDGYWYIAGTPLTPTCLKNTYEVRGEITEEMIEMERESRELIAEMLKSAQAI